MTNQATELRLDDRSRSRVLDSLEKNGEVETAKLLGVSRSSVVRAAAGRPLRRGTLMLIRLALGELGA